MIMKVMLITNNLKKFLKMISQNYNQETLYSGEIIDFITSSTNELITIPIGSRLPFFNNRF